MIRREQVFRYSQWLEVVPWQLFATLTFAWSTSEAQSQRVFAEFIDRQEKYFRCPIVFLRGDERRWSGCGKPAVPLHFHVLLAAAVRLDPAYIGDSWMKMAGHRKNGAGADVRIYDSARGALSYTLKFAVTSGGNWNFGNLDLFLRKDSTTLNA